MNVSLDMEDDLKAGEVEAMVGRLDARLKARNPAVKRVFIEIQAKDSAA